jgi:hypothetical protein
MNLPYVQRMPRPCVVTIDAIAAKTATGASAITYPVTFSMTWESCSTQDTTTPAFSPKAAAPAPKKMEKMTICRISLFAMASMTLRGTRCVTNSLNDSEAVFRFVDALASGSGRFSASPGRRMLTSTIPSISDISDAETNQPIVFKPIRPSALLSPMCAMPTTSVENTSGAIIILMRRRKMSVMSEMYPATVFADSGVGSSAWHIQPTKMPATMPTRIHVVSLPFMVSPPLKGAPAAEGRRQRHFDESGIARVSDDFCQGSLTMVLIVRKIVPDLSVPFRMLVRHV